MSTIYDSGYDTSDLKLDLQEVSFSTISTQTSTQFVIKGLGISESDTLTFVGHFTLSNGAINGGAITELDVSGPYGSMQSVGLSIPITSDGVDLSFNLGPVLTSGSTFYEKSSYSYMVGLGNDTFYGGNGTYVTPGGGINMIYANGVGEQINLKGMSTTDTFVQNSSGGSVTIIDYASSSSGSVDTITGSLRIFFGGDDTFVQDNNGVLTVTKTVAQTVTDAPSSFEIAVQDSAATVAASFDSLQALNTAGRLAGISFTDSSIPVLTISSVQLTADAGALQSITSGYDLSVTGLTVDATATVIASTGYTLESVSISDSAANVLASLDQLQSIYRQGELGTITITDGASGSPALALTPAQTVSDAGALARVTGNTAFTVDAGAASQTIDGVLGHATTVIFTGAASQYTIASSGGEITVTQGAIVDHLSNVTALQFSDVTDIVGSQAVASTGAVSSFQVATLYSAVLARTPDVSGLAYYEATAAANPSTPITTFAEYFLQSPEYTNNSQHNYPQSAAGDAQFITDTYQNLLHRAPGTGDVAFYQANVINPILASATSGTTAAELQAHAQVLAYFSQSPEFQSDVAVTAATPSSAQHWLVLN